MRRRNGASSSRRGPVAARSPSPWPICSGRTWPPADLATAVAASSWPWRGRPELPSPLDVTVHVANSDLVLPGSPVRVALRRDGRRAAAVGQVDRALGQVVHGWALDPRDPSRSLTVRLREGDRVLATVAANRFRGDLARQRLGDHAFEIWFPLALADGREHLIHVELAETGAALPGSPVTYLGRAEGPRSLLRDLTDAADPAGRGRAADILESYFLQAERDAPGSVTFADYPLWFDHFMAAPPEKSQRARGRLMLVVDLGTDLGAGPEVLRHLSADALVVGVDPAAWNDADESIREAIRRSAGGDVADRAELSPIRILNRLSGSAPGFAGDVFVLWLEPGARLLPGAADLLGRAIDEGAGRPLRRLGKRGGGTAQSAIPARLEPSLSALHRLSGPDRGLPGRRGAGATRARTGGTKAGRRFACGRWNRRGRGPSATFPASSGAAGAALRKAWCRNCCEGMRRV